jgi:geranylgeranyl pyrophosphate synthase
MKQKSDFQDPMKRAQKLLNQKGHKALPLIRKAILEEKVESKEAQEALAYFADTWRDTSRAALLAMVCEAAGGKPELTMQIAVALSLISGGYNVHDDIIDLSKQKNGKATVFGKFGKNTALLIGDALILKGLTLLNKSLNDSPKEKRLQILDIVNRMFFELGDAEILELQFRGRLDISPDRYMDVLRKKAADVEAHAWIGAIIGNASQRQVKAFSSYGRALGMLIILRDEFVDVLDLEEAIHRYQKEHLPLPVIFALQNSEAKTCISKLISKSVTQDAVMEIQKITKAARGFIQTQKLMKKTLKEALASLVNINERGNLEELATSIASVQTRREG